MTYKENIKAILECNFAGFKDEIINTACDRILEIEPCDTCNYEEGSIYCKDHCPHEAKIEQGSKTGHWIDNHNNTISCDWCKTWFNKDDRYQYMRICPYCGAKMIEV